MPAEWVCAAWYHVMINAPPGVAREVITDEYGPAPMLPPLLSRRAVGARRRVRGTPGPGHRRRTARARLRVTSRNSHEDGARLPCLANLPYELCAASRTGRTARCVACLDVRAVLSGAERGAERGLEYEQLAGPSGRALPSPVRLCVHVPVHRSPRVRVGPPVRLVDRAEGAAGTTFHAEPCRHRTASSPPRSARRLSRTPWGGRRGRDASPRPGRTRATRQRPTEAGQGARGLPAPGPVTRAVTRGLVPPP